MRHAVVVALILAAPVVTNATPCWRLGSTAAELEWADAVFLGEVEKIQLERRWVEYPDTEHRVLGGMVFPEEKLKYQQRLAVTIAMDRSWKGVDSEVIVLETDGTSGDVKFQVGTRYLVFALRTKTGSWYASACSATGHLGNPEIRARVADLGEPQVEFFIHKAARIRSQLRTTDIVVERAP